MRAPLVKYFYDQYKVLTGNTNFPENNLAVKFFLCIASFLLVSLPAINASEDCNQNLKSKILLEYFYTEGCPACSETTDVVNNVESKFKDTVTVKRFNLKDNPDMVKLLFERLDRFQIKETPALSVFSPKHAFAGSGNIISNLEKYIESKIKYSEKPAGAEIQPSQTNRNISPINRTSFSVITLAALADGINPCAFTTIILFISMLTTAGRNKKEILMVGISFCLAIYLTYLFIGVMIFETFNYVSKWKFVSEIILYIAFALAAIFAITSVYDAITIWRKRSFNGIILKLPEKIRSRIASLMRKNIKTKHIIISAFGIGIVISFLESICTGQVYFPVIAGLVRNSETLIAGIFYLFWYNFIFTLPLLFVFVLVYLGVTHKSLVNFTRDNILKVKFALAAVFTILAIWLGLEIF